MQIASGVDNLVLFDLWPREIALKMFPNVLEKSPKVSKCFTKECSPLRRLEVVVLYFVNAVGKKGDSPVVSGQTSCNMVR